MKGENDLYTLRAFVESEYGKRLGGKCWVVSLFLAKVLGRPWTATYGWMFDTKGGDHTHVFVTDGDTILDLTGDQFGWDEPVIETGYSDKRYATKFDVALKDYPEHRAEVARLLKAWKTWEAP